MENNIKNKNELNEIEKNFIEFVIISLADGDTLKLKNSNCDLLATAEQHGDLLCFKVFSDGQLIARFVFDCIINSYFDLIEKGWNK